MSEGSGTGEIVVRGVTRGEFGENTYLVTCIKTGKGIIVDPGAATAEVLGLADDEGVGIEAIVLTHAHLDHVDGVALAKRTLGAPILLHADDEPLYHAVPTQAEWFGVNVEKPPPVDRFLTHGMTVAFGVCTVTVRYTPGHSPGHVVLVGEGVAMVGDCVFAGSIGRTDLPGGDFQQLMHSIRTEILSLPDETILYPGHGPGTTVGHEKVSNPFLAADFGGRGFA